MCWPRAEHCLVLGTAAVLEQGWHGRGTAPLPGSFVVQGRRPWMVGIFPQTQVLRKPSLVICSSRCLPAFLEQRCWTSRGPLPPLSPTSPVLTPGLVPTALCSAAVTWGPAFICKGLR